MYIIYLVDYDIYEHWNVYGGVCFTTKEKAINYLLKGVKKYKTVKDMKDMDMTDVYTIDGIDYFIAKLDVFD
nr:MAG TPA: hypothetical protein [Caudoviricetes sp.]